MNRKQKQNEQKPRGRIRCVVKSADRPVAHYIRLNFLMAKRVIFADSALMLTESRTINFGL